jgi:DNA-directed RNA polymerase I, II, and III subunit RPABC2
MSDEDDFDEADPSPENEDEEDDMQAEGTEVGVDGEGDLDDDEESQSQVLGLEEHKAVDPAKRITRPQMTRFERARILGTRALQIRYAHSAI